MKKNVSHFSTDCILRQVSGLSTQYVFVLEIWQPWLMILQSWEKELNVLIYQALNHICVEFSNVYRQRNDLMCQQQQKIIQHVVIFTQK